MDLDFIKKLVKKSDTKIVLLILDGIGGLPREKDNLTELEVAKTPNLDKLARKSICGLHQPVAPGITPGSGPGHIGVFGYNPVKYQVGRGVIEALGIDFDLEDNDIAARGNFATIDEKGHVTDRRAGRISTEKNKELCNLLCKKIDIEDVEVIVKPVKEHRFLLVLRGDGLEEGVNDTDPQEIGEKPLNPMAQNDKAGKTAKMINEFMNQAKEILSNQHPANMVLLRGISKKPSWPSFPEAFGLKSAAIASYPMYRGLSKLLGMDVLKTGETIEDEIVTLKENWDRYDYFFVHVKKTDSYGEDGDFDKKVSVIEQVDRLIPNLLDLKPDVVIVTGDHSTPSALKYHSWHPVPVLLYSKHCRKDSVKKFGERDCIKGGLGPRIPAVDIMPIALANAFRLEKYGA